MNLGMSNHKEEQTQHVIFSGFVKSLNTNLLILFATIEKLRPQVEAQKTEYCRAVEHVNFRQKFTKKLPIKRKEESKN